MFETTIPTPAGGERWALVLAAGEGTRLGHLTRDSSGRSIPKQFCSVSGGPTLLQDALQRATSLVGGRRVVTVVASSHDHWWRYDTASLPTENVVVQPLNRGTAAGILLPLLTIARRDPGAKVVVLPSDHFIEREEILATAVRSAFDAVDRERDAIVLLGITPDRPDPELGWIVPAVGRRRRVQRVERFVEKPPTLRALELQRRGAVWNSFIFVARAAALIELYRRSLPELLERLAGAVAWDARHAANACAVEFAYRGLEIRDFSRDLLEPNAAVQRMLTVPACGWSDLGTPERLERCTTALASVAGEPRDAARLRPVLAAVF